MKPEAKVKVGLKSKQQADVYLELGNLGRAFAHYLVALKLMPEWKTDLKLSFSSTLCAWGEMLESQNRYTDLFKCYEQAIEVFPENEEVFGNLGAHLFRLGHLREASFYFRQALQLNSDYLTAYRNLQSVSNLLVERWHFRMLNDFNRNEAYREAILKKVKQGFRRVLDIGTGTGILSLFAVNAGAQHVFACDYSATMCDIANQVLEVNDKRKSVKVINKLSNELQIPEDIPERVSLVVTETMDAGLFGEHLLQTLIHAWESLLLPRHPHIKTIYNFTDCKSPQTHGIVIPFGATIWAVPIQCAYIARKNFVLVNRYGDVNLSKLFLSAERDEPYDTENLQNLKQFKSLCEPLRVEKINFNDPSQLADYYSGKHDSEINFSCPSKNVDAIAVWFEIHLDEDITLSSSPFHSNAKTCCWDQAVFPVRSSHDDNLRLKFKFKEGKLSIEECHNVENCDPETLAKLLQSMGGGATYQVSSEMIRFLNNKTLCERLSELANELDNIETVLDLSPFPVLGLNLIASSKTRVVSVLKNNNDVVAVKELARRNNIDMDKLECILEDGLEEFLDGCGKFDLILNNIVESTGELKEKTVGVLQTLKKHLKDGGLFLPQTFSVCCRLIDSDWLMNTRRVVDEDVVDTYKIAQFINVYQVSQHIDVDLNVLEFTAVSDSIECLLLNSDNLHQVAPLTKDLSITIQHKGCVNAIPYWFQFKMLTHDEQLLSSADQDSNVNQAVMLVEPVHVKEGDSVLLRINYLNGILKFTLLPT